MGRSGTGSPRRRSWWADTRRSAPDRWYGPRRRRSGASSDDGFPSGPGPCRTRAAGPASRHHVGRIGNGPGAPCTTRRIPAPSGCTDRRGGWSSRRATLTSTCDGVLLRSVSGDGPLVLVSSGSTGPLDPEGGRPPSRPPPAWPGTWHDGRPGNPGLGRPWRVGRRSSFVVLDVRIEVGALVRP